MLSQAAIHEDGKRRAKKQDALWVFIVEGGSNAMSSSLTMLSTELFVIRDNKTSCVHVILQVSQGYILELQRVSISASYPNYNYRRVPFSKVLWARDG